MFYLLQNSLLLVYGVFLSACFAGVLLTKKNNLILLMLSAASGLAQLVIMLLYGETVVWKMYPLITHLPIGLLLWLRYRRKFSCILAAIAAAYLCCQPAKWFGTLVQSITGSLAADQIARILVLITMGLICLVRLGDSLKNIYSQDDKSIWILGAVPIGYYVFDYLVNVYADELVIGEQTADEFLPFFLCIVYLVFCVVYHREAQRKTAAERKAQLIRFTTEQQARELDEFRSREKEIRLIRHDIRLLLNNISACVDARDWENAKEFIDRYIDRVDATVIKRFCENDTLNYVLCNVSARCQGMDIAFNPVVQLDADLPDEIALSTILSNGLDNAINAIKQMPKENRYIKLMLKKADGKLLLSVKNPISKEPVMVDGMPVSEMTGHGYGTQSIRHLTESLGGKVQFTVEDRMFILRVVI